MTEKSSPGVVAFGSLAIFALFLAAMTYIINIAAIFGVAQYCMETTTGAWAVTAMSLVLYTVIDRALSAKFPSWKKLSQKPELPRG